MRIRKSASQEAVCGVGVDIVEIDRIARIRQLRRFAEYFLIPEELQDFKKSPDPLRFIASRFALKEAVIKAFPGNLGRTSSKFLKKARSPLLLSSPREQSAIMHS